MTAVSRSEPSEAAQLLVAAVLPHLSARDAEHLRRLIGDGLASPEPVVLREARLGLLIDLVTERTGEVPSVQAYEDLRVEREERGERWPSHSTLARAYGGWLGAVRAAMQVDVGRNPWGTPSKRHRVPAYTRDEALAAVARCRSAMGAWPTEQEYVRWRRVERRGARGAGVLEPRLPSAGSLRRLTGTFSEAVRGARERVATEEHRGA